MTDALFRHEGLLDKYTGDGLMAMFIAQEECSDVRRAVKAAIAMRDAVVSVSTGLQAEKNDTLGFGFGLHYGEAVVGLVGNPIQFNYTAMGHAVVVAQRIQSEAEAGSILITEAVSTGAFLLAPAIALQVKGVTDAVMTYEVLGESPTGDS